MTSGSKALCLLDLGTRWREMFSFTALAILLLVKQTALPLKRRRGRPRNILNPIKENSLLSQLKTEA
jgi:hypothetical protein